MRRRLVLVAAATTTMVALAFVVPLGLLVRTFAHERALREAEVEARALAPTLAAVDDPEALASAVSLASSRSPGALTVFMPDGTTFGVDRPADEHVAAAAAGRAFTTPTAGGAATLVPVLRTDGSVAVVRVLVPGAVLNEGVAPAWAMLAALGLVLVAAAVAVADRLGRSTVAAVQQLEHVAERIGRGELDARAGVDDPPEVAAVAAALHTLAGRVRALLAAERETVADLSHRIRTPLMALRLDAEALPPSALARRLLDDADALERAVEEVIRRARRSARDAAVPHADLVAVVSARTDFWRALAEDQERPFTLDLPETSLPVPLPADEVEAVIDALLGNVFAHTPEGTPFHVGVVADGSGCRLVVEDRGPGFQAASVVARGVSGGGSTGLGLDIVRNAAGRTGGDLTVGDSSEGGARIVVRFGSSPATPPAEAEVADRG